MAIIFHRRAFLRNSALLVMAPIGLDHGLSTEAGSGSPSITGLSGEQAQAFASPPDSARPWVYWFVSDGNITREGITADLEAMHRAGIRGLIYMEVDQGVPKGPARFLSPQWRELMQHALKEATRLGITVDMNNDGGWCGSGGPWITPELSMQVIVWSETHVEGPMQFRDALGQPSTVKDFYRDIAVLAYPVPPAEGIRMADCSPQLSYGLDRKALDATKLLDGNPGSIVNVPWAGNESGQRQYINIEFQKPFSAQALTVAIAMERWEAEIAGELQVSEDGQKFRTIRPVSLRCPVSSVNFDKVMVRHYRIAIDSYREFYSSPNNVNIPIELVEFHDTSRIEDIPGKAAYRRQDVQQGGPAIPPDMAVRKDQVLDISQHMDRDGRLIWDVPPGKWKVLRLGHTTTGKTNHPAPMESLGLECDKLNKKAVEVHFEAFIGKMIADQKAVGAKALTIAHIDSWEVQSQNWTPELRGIFLERYGYDLLPYLPTLTGLAVESREISERFLWDLRRLVADLTLENYAEHMRELCHKNGLQLSIEAYADGVFDEVAYAGRADLPVGEFWMSVQPDHGLWDSVPTTWVKEMSSSGHVYGNQIVAAEAFTSFASDAKWQNHPYQMKPLGDWAFANGINRFIFHRYSMQPWRDRKPGMTMGETGVNYERTNTWWEMSRAWHDYLARCQYLLQQGLFVADIACLGGENSTYTFPKRASIEPSIPAGFDYDNVPAEVLLKYASVRDGRLVLKSGMSYRLLTLPPGRTMRPGLLRKIKELVAAGLTVVGPRPEGSPSLAEFPQCDQEVRQIADELWGDIDGAGIVEKRLGQGKVIWGRPLVQILADMETPPDLACQDVSVGEGIHYIHRRLEGGDLFFVASAYSEAKRFLLKFRVEGRRPEFWWPDSGRTERVAAYDIERVKYLKKTTTTKGRTLIPIELPPHGSVFVFFGADQPPQPERVVSIRRDNVEISGLPATPMRDIQLIEEPIRVSFQDGAGAGYQIEGGRPGSYELRLATGRRIRAVMPMPPPPVEIRGPWDLEFPPGQGAPARVALPELISWASHGDAGVRFFSGTATYSKKFELPATLRAKDVALYLDLGRVCVIAEAQLNGRKLGILWKPPFRVEVTDLVRAGVNELVVRVANLWPNRLIGDEQLPSDREWSEADGGALKRYPQWLLEEKPSPAGRVTFTTWKLWGKDDPLLESGLIGPVTLRATMRVRVGS